MYLTVPIISFFFFFHFREGPKVMDISDVHFLVRNNLISVDLYVVQSEFYH